MKVVKCQSCRAKNRIDETRAAAMKPVCGKCGKALDLEAKQTPEKPIVVSDATLASELEAVGSVPLLLDCWAPWCGPCRLIAPALEQLAAESEGRYVIAKLNVDENPRTAAKFKIQSIPTMLVFKRGAVVDRLVGLMPKEQIAAKLAGYAG